MKLRKGDMVEIISGDDRGRRGKILEIQRDKRTGRARAVVEGLNLAKKHRRTSGPGKPGGIIDLPVPIDLSNMVLLCPKCGKRSSIRREEHGDGRARVCRECDEMVDV
ncbi:MAG: 50S ribosomal protein L24 [bacterium]